MRLVRVALVACVLGLSAGRGWGGPPTVSEETTYFTSPLRGDGTVDYVEAINARLSRGVTVRNNAAVVLMAVFGGDPVHSARVAERLGLATLPEVVLREADLAAEPPGFEDAQREPWTPDDAPAVAAWLKRLQRGLDVVVEASGREQYYMPMVGRRAGDPVLTVQLPHLNVMGSIVRTLRARAMVRLGTGDGAGFRADAVALVRVGRLTSHAATVVERLVARRAEEAGLDVIRAAVSGADLSGADAERLLAELRRAPAWFEESGLAERTFTPEFIQTAAVRGAPAAMALIGPSAAGAGRGEEASRAVDATATRDWDAALREADAWARRAVEAQALPTHAERSRELAAIRRELAGIEANAVDGAASARIEDRVLVMAVSRMAQAVEDDVRLRALRVLTETALALSAFRSKAGEYPATLGELVPAYFAREPLNPFTDGPLEYRPGGGYVLSSAGPAGGRAGSAGGLTVRVEK